jgi:hypothetical protein
MITLECTIQFKHDFLSYLVVQKIIHTLQNNVHMLSFPYFVMGFTLESMAQATLIYYKEESVELLPSLGYGVSCELGCM